MLKDIAVVVTRCRDRIMTIKVVEEGEGIKVMCTYTQHTWHVRQQLVLVGDFKNHIGIETDGYPGVHVRGTDEGRLLPEFSIAHDLVITNRFF